MNGTMLQGFSWNLTPDGAHWGRIEERAADFARWGVTAVWLPPAYKGAAGANDVGYGVYDVYDMGEFDQKGSVATKYGTRAEYEAAIAALHAQGIQVIADVVLNQRLGADTCEKVVAREFADDDRQRQTAPPQTVGAWTGFSFPGRDGAHSDFVWDWRCFHGVGWSELHGREGVWLFEGKEWDEGVQREENGNYDFLLGADVDVNHPPVYEELLRWGAWYLDTFGIDGFRLDAVKHIDRGFFLRWLHDLRTYTGRELFSVGEYWSGNVDELVGYLGHERAMSLFDVPLHFRLADASRADGNVDLTRIFDGTLVATDPTRAVTFVENHDTQPGQSLESSVAAWFKPAAYALILLREAGYPCVFHGDLYGMRGDGEHERVAELPLLMGLRRLNAYGKQLDYLDHPDVIGWTREGDREHPGSGLACVISDRGPGEKRMYVGGWHAGETWRCVMGGQHDVVIDDDGAATFRVAGGCCSVYVPA